MSSFLQPMRNAGMVSVFLLLSGATCLGQETPPVTLRISGLVHTGEGVAVPGATVRVLAAESGKVWVSWTDEKGSFEFPSVPERHYRVEVTQLGFATATLDVDVASASASPLDVLLQVGLDENPAPSTVTKDPAGHTAGASHTASPPIQPASKQASNDRQESIRGGSGQRVGAIPAEVTNTAPQGIDGFQQVDITGQDRTPNTQLQNNNSDVNLSTSSGALGGASSSDAFLMNGTVSRGTAGGDAGLALDGPDGPGAAGPQVAGGGPFPVQGGGQGNTTFPTEGGGPRGGRAAPRGRGRGPQRGGGPGVGELWGAQRIMRQQANRIRWSLHERYANSVWDARPYSLTESNPAKIGHYDERLDGNVGGPLILPKLYNGRDKTFFFVNYEFGHSQSPVDSFPTVPTADDRRGNFCSRGLQLYDRNSNLAGPRNPLGCSIPSAKFDPAAVSLLQFIPQPNLPGTTQNYHLQTIVPVDLDRVNLRVVHTINKKLNGSVGYNFSSTRQTGIQNFQQLLSRQSVRGQNFNAGLTQNISPHLLNSIQFNWNRSRVRTVNGFAFVDNVAGDAGITGISADPINYGLPLISFTNFTGWSDPVPASVRNQTARVTNSVTYTRGKHSFRAGAEFRRIQNNHDNDPIPRGEYSFTGRMTSQLDGNRKPVTGTGFDFADFLLGLPDTTTAQFGMPSVYLRNWGSIGYAQDDWHVTPKLTLQYAVRYEFFTPPIELYNHIANLDLNRAMNAVARVQPGQLGPYSGALPRSLIRSDTDNWAPRLGFAWKPRAKMALVVRAGYGMFYNESIYNQLVGQMTHQPPFAQALTLQTSPQQTLTLENGFPSQPQGTLNNTKAVNPNYDVGYAQIWNFSVESQIKQNWVATLTYTGTKGTALDLLLSPNRAAPGSPPPIPGAAIFTFDTSGAASIYHALQATVQHRFAHGVMFRGVYTYGKSIDNASSIGGGAAVVVQDERNIVAERGLSSFDIRHQFTGSWVYELPFGERKPWLRRGMGAHLLGNMRVNGFAAIQAGSPYTARVLGNLADCGGTGAIFSGRADQVGDANQLIGDQTPLHWFNTAAFTPPPCGRLGNAARNTIIGPGMTSVSFSVSRGLRFGQDGRHRMDIRWDVQNLFNTPNFTGLSTVVNSQTYGRVLGVRGMRTMAMNIRWNW